MYTLVKYAIVSLSVIAQWIPIHSSTMQDFCEWDTFNATCKENQVIQMEHAHYGRMSLGRCVQRDYGYIGCHVDVLSYLDSICSGRQTCQLTFPDKNLDTGHQPCPGDLEAYIQIKYTCIPVFTSTRPCAANPLPVSGRSGLLGNFITGQTGQGSPACPWEVHGSVGQTIRLSLLDYGVWTLLASDSSRSLDRDTPESPVLCQIYATVTDGSTKLAITICGGQAREQVIYHSRTNGLQIAMKVPTQSAKPVYFLLRYEILGCPKYIPPEGAVIEQQGDDISVRCTDSENEWRLSCDGSHWRAEGEVTNCTRLGEPSMSFTSLFDGVLKLPQGIQITIIIAIAVLIAIIILVVGVVIFRRKQESRLISVSNSRIDQEKYSSHQGFTKEHYPMLAKNQTGRQSLREREYTTTLHRHMAVPPGGMTPQGEFSPLSLSSAASFPDSGHFLGHWRDLDTRDSNHTTFKPLHTEHIYESPKFSRRTHSENNICDPFNNGLDQEHDDRQNEQDDPAFDPGTCGQETSVVPPPQVFFPSSFKIRK